MPDADSPHIVEMGDWTYMHEAVPPRAGLFEVAVMVQRDPYDDYPWELFCRRLVWSGYRWEGENSPVAAIGHIRAVYAWREARSGPPPVTAEVLAWPSLRRYGFLGDRTSKQGTD